MEFDAKLVTKKQGYWTTVRTIENLASADTISSTTFANKPSHAVTLHKTTDTIAIAVDGVAAADVNVITVIGWPKISGEGVQIGATNSFTAQSWKSTATQYGCITAVVDVYGFSHVALFVTTLETLTTGDVVLVKMLEM